MKARERWERRMAEGRERRKGRQVEAWTCTPSDVPPGRIVEDGCGTRHRTRATAERCARRWTRRRRRPVSGLRGEGRGAILPAVPVRIDRRTRQRLPPRTPEVREEETPHDTADVLAAITRRKRKRLTCRACDHVRDGAIAGKCPSCGAPVPGFEVDP